MIISLVFNTTSHIELVVGEGDGDMFEFVEKERNRIALAKGLKVQEVNLILYKIVQPKRQWPISIIIAAYLFLLVSIYFLINKL